MRIGIVLAVLLIGAPAAADLDPAKAQVSVDAALGRGDAVFCKKPPVPLLGHARDLCPHASAIAGCEALVKACGEEAPMERGVPLWLRSIAMIAVYILFAVFAVVVAIGIFALVRSARKSAKSTSTEPEEEEAPHADTSNEAPAALLARANALRESDPEKALALYLRASLVALDVRGAIHIADDRTNGEYLRACRETKSKEPLRTIVGEVERVRFGSAPAGGTMVERVARAAAAIVVSAMLLSCDAAGRMGLGPAADPAGLTLISETLVSQGVDVRGTGSLVRLPLPKPTDAPPVVLVDLDSVDLEDDAEAHLRAWADAGGTLVVAGKHAASFVETTQTLATTTEVRTPTLLDHGVLRTPEGLTPRGGCTIIASAAQTPFALLCAAGRGFVLAMATDDLVANAGFARGHNASIAIAILASVEPQELRIASPADGASPPDSPLASLNRAGLGPGLWHGFLGALLLFWAVGARLARPKPADPPARRAFLEHVEATGALHARRGTAKHALASFVRFTEDRARGDVPLSISHRTGVSLSECEAVWTRARNPAPGSELAALRALHRLVSRSSSPR